MKTTEILENTLISIAEDPMWADHCEISKATCRNIVAALSSLRAENATLQSGYAAARLEIESLQARIKTMAEEHADELMVAHLDGMRAAQPAGAQQPGAAYAALPEMPQFPAHPEPMVMDWSAIEISVIAQYGRDMYEAGKRASHGQAPALAAPKAAPGDLHDHQILAITTAYEQGVGKGRQAHESGKEIANPYDTGYRCDLAWQYGYEEGKKQAERIAETAPQQDAQEPVAWYVTGGSRLLDEDEAKAEAQHIGGTARAMPLYTAPQADSQPVPVPDWLPFSKRKQIADRHGVKVTAEFNALVRDVIQTYLETRAPRAASAPADSVPEDVARLDWLDKNIFHREMGDWDAKYGHGSGYNMWVLFSPKGAQGSARSIIDAARKEKS